MAGPDRSHYDAQSIAKHFDDYGLREWERLVATPVDEVNLFIRNHYLKKYIPAGARVLEIGAGAEGCASGSHAWKGTSAALRPKPATKRLSAKARPRFIPDPAIAFEM